MCRTVPGGPGPEFRVGVAAFLGWKSASLIEAAYWFHKNLFLDSFLEAKEERCGSWLWVFHACNRVTPTRLGGAVCPDTRVSPPLYSSHLYLTWMPRSLHLWVFPTFTYIYIDMYSFGNVWAKFLPLLSTIHLSLILFVVCHHQVEAASISCCV